MKLGTGWPEDSNSLRASICEIGRRMYENKLVSATDGNISVRIDTDRFLCTPSGVSKGFMKPDDLVVADARGRVLSGTGKVTSEFFTHLAAYEERSDISCVCHAHPPNAVAGTLLGLSFEEPVLPEVVMSLGGIPTAPYATPASMEGNVVIRNFIRECDALLIARHGAITVGTDPYDAYYKLEKVEHAAYIILLARGLGEVPPLGSEDVRKLYEAHANYGGKGRLYQKRQG